MITIFADYHMSADEVITLFDRYIEVISNPKLRSKKARSLQWKYNIVFKRFKHDMYVPVEYTTFIGFVDSLYAYRSGRIHRNHPTKFVKWFIESKIINNERISKIIWKDDTMLYNFDDGKIIDDMHKTMPPGLKL